MNELSTHSFGRISLAERRTHNDFEIHWLNLTHKMEQVWLQFNRQFFRDELTKPVIEIMDTTPVIEITDTTEEFEDFMEVSLFEVSLFGAYKHKDGVSYICISSNFFKSFAGLSSPELEAVKFKFAKDVLLHEMVHQLIEETGEPDAIEEQYGWHGPLYAALCNRIGVKLGLDLVYVNFRPLCSAWPDSGRRIEYYIPPLSRLSETERVLVREMFFHIHSIRGPDTFNDLFSGDDPYGGGGIALQHPALLAREVIQLQSTLAA
jgi:hypothetical protein